MVKWRKCPQNSLIRQSIPASCHHSSLSINGHRSTPGWEGLISSQAGRLCLQWPRQNSIDMPIGWWWYLQMTVEIFARKGENKGGAASSVCVGKKEWRVGRQGTLNFKQAPPLTTFRDLNQSFSPTESVSTCVKWEYWYLFCLSYRFIRRIQWIIHLWLLLWKHYENHKDSYLEIWVLIIIFVCFLPISTVISNAGDSDWKESACNAGEVGSIPESGRSPGEGNGYPLQYSYLENSMDWGAYWDTAHGVTKSQTWLNHNTFTSDRQGSKSHRRNFVHQTLNFRTTEWVVTDRPLKLVWEGILFPYIKYQARILELQIAISSDHT